ncbi:MAG: lipopolysaccharide biosynthesis protein [Armatimonadota bacterium]|nr:lipopolysaccharide biosynthesis protein [Armatimonadota bacterium]
MKFEESTLPPVALRRLVFSSVLWQTASALYVYLVRLAALVILARLLSPRDFGLVASATIIIGLGNLFGHLGIGNALLQKASIQEKDVYTAFWLSTLSGLLLSILVFLTAPLFARLLGSTEVIPLIRVLTVTFVLVAVSNVSRAQLQRDLRFGALSILQAASYTAGYLVVGFLMARGGYGHWALVGAHLTEVVVSSVGAFLWAPQRIRCVFDMEAARQMLSFGVMQTLAVLLNYAATQFDRVLVARWLGMTPLGWYTRASYLPTFAASLVDAAVGRVGFAAGSRVQNEEYSFRAGTLQSTTLLLLLLAPAAILCALLAREIVSALLGPKWMPVVPLLQVFSVGIVADSLSRLAYYLLLAKGKVVTLVALQAAYVVCVVACTLAGLPYGAIGVAAGVVTASFVNLFLHLAALSRAITLSLRDMRGVLLPSLAGSAMTALLTVPIVTTLRALQLPGVFTLFGTLFILGWLLVLLRKPILRVLQPIAGEVLGEVGHSARNLAHSLAASWRFSRQGGGTT